MVGKDYTSLKMKKLDHIHRVACLGGRLTDSQKRFMHENAWPPVCECGEMLDSTPNGVADYFCPNCYNMYDINIVTGRLQTR